MSEVQLVFCNQCLLCQIKMYVRATGIERLRCLWKQCMQPEQQKHTLRDNSKRELEFGRTLAAFPLK